MVALAGGLNAVLVNIDGFWQASEVGMVRELREDVEMPWRLSRVHHSRRGCGCPDLTSSACEAKPYASSVVPFPVIREGTIPPDC